MAHFFSPLSRVLARFLGSLCVFAALCAPLGAFGSPDTHPRQGAVASRDCWQEAARYHGVDVWLLYSIAWVESGYKPHVSNRNKNGSVDIGMMQINSIWWPELRKWGIQPSQLYDACTSVYIGAWILSKNIRSYGYTWRAIAAYNTANPSIGLRYARKVYAAHRSLTGQPTLYFAPQQTASR